MPNKEPTWKYHQVGSSDHGLPPFLGAPTWVMITCRDCRCDLRKDSYWTLPEGAILCGACAGKAWWGSTSRVTKEDIEEIIREVDELRDRNKNPCLCEECADGNSDSPQPLGTHYCDDCRRWLCLSCWRHCAHPCHCPGPRDNLERLAREMDKYGGPEPESSSPMYDEHQPFLMAENEGRFYGAKERMKRRSQIMAAWLGRIWRMMCKQRWTHWLELVGISIGLLAVGFGLTHVRGCVAARWAEDAVTYEAVGDCTNCGMWFSGKVRYPLDDGNYARIPLGVKFEEAPCPKCGFKTLVREKDD